MAVKISSFGLVCLRYTVIGVIYMYIYDKVSDIELGKNDTCICIHMAVLDA